MKKIKDSLNYIGLVLIGLSLVLIKIWPYRKTAAFILAILGLASIAAYVFFNLSALKKNFKRKSFLYSSNLFLIIILVLAILVIANYILSKHHYRVDFTQSKTHSLSDQSVRVLKGLKNDVTIKCFFREGNMSRATMDNLLKIYAYHSGKIKSEFIDPDKNPGLVKRYDVNQDGTSILESGDKENRITAASEEEITNALIKVTREMKKVIYFLEGHGEGPISETTDKGYSTVKTELEKLGYEVKKQSLALADTFPKDCAMLVIPGPQKDFLPNELETIKNYIDGGGRVFFMIDPETMPGISPYLQTFGVKLENDLVVDTVSRLLGGDYFMPVISEYEFHEITKNFRYATFFPFARSVEVAETKPDGITTTVLAKTSPNSWSERELDQKEVKFNKDKDKQGPVPVAIVATIKRKAPETSQSPENPEAPKTPETPKAEGRIAVFGDSDFASNRYFNLSGNGNFFLNTLNWLTEESDLISIQSKTSSPRTIQLSPPQGRMIFFASVIILPLVMLLLGVSIWVRRRSL